MLRSQNACTAEPTARAHDGGVRLEASGVELLAGAVPNHVPPVRATQPLAGQYTKNPLMSENLNTFSNTQRCHR